MPARFQPGTITATPGVLSAVPREELAGALRRHLSGDWGLVDPDDARENDLSVEQGFRILSAYEHEGTTFWVITEADRSSTTFLLPEEY